MSSPHTDVLDHIVHLTPPGTVDETSHQWRSLGFTVVPGGTHADGLTANPLVVLRDGVYIELISFTHPLSYYPPGSRERQARESHSWAHKSPGWIDFAFLGASSPGKISQAINERAEADGSGVEYKQEQKGGRVRPDGRRLEWLITAPGKEGKRGVWPFFCGDVSPRDWRVPLNPRSNGEHSSKALGIAHVRLLAPESDLSALSRQLTTIIGLPSSPDPHAANGYQWALQTSSSHVNAPAPKLTLSLPLNDDERKYLHANGPGVYEVAFWVRKDGTVGETKTPFGKVVFSVVDS